MENPIWEILFYLALAALIIVLYIKKRKQVKDTVDIEHTNQTKEDEN